MDENKQKRKRGKGNGQHDTSKLFEELKECGRKGGKEREEERRREKR